MHTEFVEKVILKDKQRHKNYSKWYRQITMTSLLFSRKHLPTQKNLRAFQIFIKTKDQNLG